MIRTTLLTSSEANYSSSQQQPAFNITSVTALFCLNVQAKHPKNAA